jgi:tetratricopeptide (TPR) repeat protein
MTDANALKDQGNNAFRDKRFKEAVSLYSRAIALAPHDGVLYSNRSAAHLSDGNLNDALEDASQCVRLKPDWEKGWMREDKSVEALVRGFATRVWLCMFLRPVPRPFCRCCGSSCGMLVALRYRTSLIVRHWGVVAT